ncbi:response regulator [Sulfitobacter sp. SK012]|uniref:response regulator n=1 Tax=Sulfitobacter sp. SK012 TaxID=1389005 RepID=UPI0020C7C402|nr:response regulator [Sulfitobacter sp. SK012]
MRRRDNDITATCLIVEDSIVDQKMMARAISRTNSNIRVEVAATLNAARQVLRSDTISMILLDNNLPYGFGANFALELASDRQLSRIPVIMFGDWPSPFMW